VDGRSDIFGLGVLLHELIHGEPPFRGDSAAETMTAITKSDAPPLAEGTPSGASVINCC
jgi:serine/threonine protein kinase